MCGIAGLIGKATLGEWGSPLRAALEELQHRGPDGSGVQLVSGVPVALGHQRLSIIDLSDAASQPMWRSLNGCLHTIVFNGEIYNYRELRAQLAEAGVLFTTNGDTEVLLNGCAVWGPAETCRRVRGMFAFVYVNSGDRKVWMGRDRFGEKPLYYFANGGTVGFASELKALRRLPGMPTDLDRGAIAQMLSAQAVSAPATVHAGVRQVPAGALVTLPPAESVDPGELAIVRYWDTPVEAAQAASQQFKGTLAEAADELERLLDASVTASMVSDVPIGAFLSGGIDSSVIVALMKRSSSGPVKTFTIGFDDRAFSEADEARRVADHLGVEHTELTVRPQDALDIVPRLPDLYDEPFGDSSQIPTFLVSALARTQVTVSLSGDGGDELFGGYTRYSIADRVRGRMLRVPVPIRRGIATSALKVPASQWQRLASLPGLQRVGEPRRLGERIHRTAPMLRARNDAEFYQGFVSSWHGAVVLDVPASPAPGLPPANTFIEEMMLLDTLAYLPDDILVKVDRAAMAASLETRVPFLDPDVFRFAWSLPLSYRIDGDVGKVVLREVLARHVPTELWDRPKMGFGVPIAEWLRGPLRQWGEDLLAPGVLRRQQLLDVSMIRKAWDEHQQSVADNSARLWNVLMLQAWLQRWTTL